MKEQEKETRKMVEYGQVKMDILKQVNEVGLLGDRESWIKAFPGLGFEQEEHKWEERTLAEMMFFVAMKKTAEMEVRYQMEVEGELVVNETVENKEIIEKMWMDGCFSGEELTEEALHDFINISLKSGMWIDTPFEDVDLAKVEVISLEARVEPF